MSTQALVYIGSVCVTGLAILVDSISRTGVEWNLQFLLLLVAGAVASVVRVTIPGITGSYSANFLVLIYALGQLTQGQLLMVAVTSMVAQTLRTRVRFQPLQLAFNVCGICIVTGLAHAAYSSSLVTGFVFSNPLLRLGLATGVYYLSNTLLTAAVIGFTERESVMAIWTASSWSWMSWTRPSRCASTTHWRRCTPFLSPAAHGPSRTSLSVISPSMPATSTGSRRQTA